MLQPSLCEKIMGNERWNVFSGGGGGLLVGEWATGFLGVASCVLLFCILRVPLCLKILTQLNLVVKDLISDRCL